MSIFKHIGYFLLGALFIVSIPLLLVVGVLVTIVMLCYGGGKILCGGDPPSWMPYR